MYWPNIASDIKQIADMCETCQEMKPRNPPEPLRQHSDGDEPWQKIGLDLFEIAGKHYLAVVDYYSNFIEVDLLTTMTSVYCDVAQETLCSLWHTENDCVGRRSTVYKSGV